MKKHYEPLKLEVVRISDEDVLTVSPGNLASPSREDGYFYTDWDVGSSAGE